MAGGKNKKPTLSAEFLATATPREMAAARCSITEERNLTAEEDEALSAKLREMKPSKVKEFQKYILCNRAMMFSYYPLLKLAQGMYEREVHAVLSRLLCIKTDICGAETFTKTYRLYKMAIRNKGKEKEEELKEDLQKIFNPASKTFTDKVRLTFSDGDRATINEAEVVEVIRKEIWERRVILDTLEQFKAGVEVLDKWTEVHDLRPFIPKWVLVVMDEARVDYSEELGLQRYSRTHLREREARGDTITDLERKVAILPSYDEVRVSDDVFFSWNNKLEEIL